MFSLQEEVNNEGKGDDCWISSCLLQISTIPWWGLDICKYLQIFADTNSPWMGFDICKFAPSCPFQPFPHLQAGHGPGLNLNGLTAQLGLSKVLIFLTTSGILEKISDTWNQTKKERLSPRRCKTTRSRWFRTVTEKVTTRVRMPTTTMAGQGSSH